MVSIYWLIAFVVLMGIEASSMALTTVWFAGGTFVAFLLSLFGFSVETQLIVFVIISMLLLFFTRPLAIKYVNKNLSKTNTDSLIGQQVKVTSEINNTAGTGSAVINGQEWTARAEDSNAVYAADTVLVVKEISGVKLIVGELKEEH